MNYNPFTLSGKKILVTGASSGIGRSIAVECSKMGANLIITGSNQQRLEETLTLMDGTTHQASPADIANVEEIDNLVRQVPTLDGIVLNA